MRALCLALGVSLPAIAQDAGQRVSDLIEAGPSARKALLDEVRAAKDAGDPNGVVPLAEALIALADGRALEASEYAKRAAEAKTLDFGDRERDLAAIEAGGTPEPRPARARAVRELLEFLMAWGEEWEWRGKGDAARAAYASVAGICAHALRRSSDVEESLALANLRYRAYHHLAGLALRAGDDAEFRVQAAQSSAAHGARTAVAAAPAARTREEWVARVETGSLGAIREFPDVPDHPVAALADAPKTFSGKTPAAVLFAALDDRFGERSLPLRWDAAMALRGHTKEVAPALRKWAKSAERPSVAWALLALAGEAPDIPEDRLDDPWTARACGDENALERAMESLPKANRVAVAFRLKDLRGEDEVELGR